MGRKSTVYDVYLNAVKEKEHNLYMDMLKNEEYTSFVKSMVNAAKEGDAGITATLNKYDSPDEIKKKWMFIKHIIKSFKHQFEYKISLYSNLGDLYGVTANCHTVKSGSNPIKLHVLWAEHNKYTKQNIIRFIICLVAFIGIWTLLLLNAKTDPDFISFIIVCAILPITLCSLGYGYRFGKELYYHYFGWYLILKGIERAGF